MFRRTLLVYSTQFKQTTCVPNYSILYWSTDYGITKFKIIGLQNKVSIKVRRF